MARALVTGGNGFLGRHLVAALVARGEQVRVLDHEPAPVFDPDVEVVQGSILDELVVEQALGGVDLLYHMPAFAHLRTSDPRAIYWVNP